MALNEMQKKERSEYLKNLKITGSESEQEEPYVFISYASDDWETVFKEVVVPLQQEHGLRVFADKRFEEKNDKWYLEAKRNIRDAKMVLAFVSRNYIKSYPCFYELEIAVRFNREIVYIPLEQELTFEGLEELKIELSVKELILEEGRNIKMNAGSSSKDVMRAMATAFSGIESFLQEETLKSKDLTKAFIEFFHGAVLNEKTINNLEALKSTIDSVNTEVFDQSLKSKTEQSDKSATTNEADEPARQSNVSTETKKSATQSKEQKKADKPEVQSAAPVSWFGKLKKTIGKKKLKAILTVSSICIIAVIGSILIVVTHSNKNGEIVQHTSESGGTQETIKFPSGAVYEGESKNGLPDGQGTITFTSGAVYEGEFKDGYYDGQGTMTFVDGAVYEGEWKDNQMCGKGIMTYADGSVYEGEWKDGKTHGKGTVTFDGGQVYEGEFKEGCYDGQGTMKFANGDVYEGEWKDNQMCGKGTLTYADGTVNSGTWINGKLLAE